ncbi:MAG: hypothetical protein ACP5DC_10475 [Halothiobacillaceae bacterium]
MSVDQKRYLRAQIEPLEYLAFALIEQDDLDRLTALYAQWVAQLGDSPEAIALCDALDDWIDACIDDRADAARAYLDLMALLTDETPTALH